MNSLVAASDPSINRDKDEIVKQWNNDPCEGMAGKGLEVGSRAFYERIDHYRYVEFAPWMKSVMEYDQFRGKRLLEVGFGMGTDLFQFAINGAIVSGIDLVPKHLEIATKRFDLYGIPADLRLGDAESMPYENESFDAVYTFGAIHHTPDTQKAIDEIYRVLKPGGRAIIGVYHKWSVFYVFQTLLGNYVLRLRFLREPLRRTLSRIEYREQSDACPLVKAYSKQSLGHMLRAFAFTRFEIRHLTRNEFSIFRQFVPPSFPARLEKTLGWFLIAKCLK
jgi:ubiquinone/menaquinone biosynthesis C-methylase UbiE